MKLNEEAPKGKYEDLPLEKMTVDELRAMKANNLDEMTHIQVQLGRQTADYLEHGKNGDFGWTVRAKAALRHKGHLDQRIAQELGRRKRQEKNANIERARDRNEWFCKAAYQYLSAEDFRAIERLADEMEG